MNTSSYKSLMFTFSQANPSDEQLLDAMQRLRAVAGRQPFYFTLTLRARQLPRDRQGVEPGMVHLREGKLYTGYAPFSESEKWLDAGVVAEDGSLRVLGGKARPQNKKDFSIPAQLNRAGLPASVIPRRQRMPTTPFRPSMKAQGWGGTRRKGS